MAVAKKKATEIIPIIYELANLSESQQWILMIDDSYRVKP